VCIVLRPGFFTTVQDIGRPGYRAFGVPLAGAMDRFAYTLANMLAGNQPGAAVLEMTLRGASFRFKQDAFVAVCGADMQGTLNGKRIHAWSSLSVPAGSELAFGHVTEGSRAYLAFYGGIAVAPVLGSRSTYTRAGIGGYQGRPLQAGDVLDIGRMNQMPKKSIRLSQRFLPRYEREVWLRTLLGPQDDYFSAAGIKSFFNSIYKVTSRSDRMGYLLDGRIIERVQTADMISDALCPGAVQVPGNGMPIIMMSDCQTIGGYPKIGIVIGPDVSRLAQARTGDAVRFIQCSDEEAVAALKKEHEQYAEYGAILAHHRH
jgi:antagonist of KipI